MDSISLIGMPAAGKSTIGVLLAKALGYTFLDTDLIIQTGQNALLPDIIKEQGIQYFLDIENKTLCDLMTDRHVIATGGSAVYSSRGMSHLSEISTIFYLDVPLKEIEKRIDCITCRGIIISKDKNLNDLYIEREPLYRKYAHHIVDCSNKNTEQIVDLIISRYQQ